MVIEDEDTAEENDDAEEEDVSGTAYREQMVSTDGFTRGPKGQVKFNKNTKKRRAEEDMMDVDMADGTTPASKQPKSKRQEVVRLGQEFKSKKSGGDVKRHGQQDPYAYVTLSEIGKGKKGGKGGRISFTGKK